MREEITLILKHNKVPVVVIKDSDAKRAFEKFADTVLRKYGLRRGRRCR